MQTSLADRLRKCAEIVGSGDELARRSGIPRSTLETYFTGKTEPKADRLAEICHLCGVDGHWLLTGSGAMQPTPSLAATAPPSDLAQCMAIAVLAVEQAIANSGKPFDAQRRTALTMLAYDQVLCGKQGAALETFVLHLVTLAEVSLNPEEQALIESFRNATPEQRFLISRHITRSAKQAPAQTTAQIA